MIGRSRARLGAGSPQRWSLRRCSRTAAAAAGSRRGRESPRLLADDRLPASFDRGGVVAIRGGRRERIRRRPPRTWRSSARRASPLPGRGFLSTTGDLISIRTRGRRSDFVLGRRLRRHPRRLTRTRARHDLAWYGRLLGAYFAAISQRSPSGRSCAIATITSRHDGLARSRTRHPPLAISWRRRRAPGDLGGLRRALRVRHESSPERTATLTSRPTSTIRGGFRSAPASWALPSDRLVSRVRGRPGVLHRSRSRRSAFQNDAYRPRPGRHPVAAGGCRRPSILTASDDAVEKRLERDDISGVAARPSRAGAGGVRPDDRIIRARATRVSASGRTMKSFEQDRGDHRRWHGDGGAARQLAAEACRRDVRPVPETMARRRRSRAGRAIGTHSHHDRRRRLQRGAGRVPRCGRANTGPITSTCFNNAGIGAGGASSTTAGPGEDLRGLLGRRLPRLAPSCRC